MQNPPPAAACSGCLSRASLRLLGSSRSRPAELGRGGCWHKLGQHRHRSRAVPGSAEPQQDLHRFPVRAAGMGQVTRPRSRTALPGRSLKLASVTLVNN